MTRRRVSTTERNPKWYKADIGAENTIDGLFGFVQILGEWYWGAGVLVSLGH